MINPENLNPNNEGGDDEGNNNERENVDSDREIIDTVEEGIGSGSNENQNENERRGRNNESQEERERRLQEERREARRELLSRYQRDLGNDDIALEIGSSSCDERRALNKRLEELEIKRIKEEISTDERAELERVRQKSAYIERRRGPDFRNIGRLEREAEDSSLTEEQRTLARGRVRDAQRELGSAIGERFQDLQSQRVGLENATGEEEIERMQFNVRELERIEGGESLLDIIDFDRKEEFFRRENIERMERERERSDRNLMRGGATEETNERGEQVVRITGEQQERIEREMEEDFRRRDRGADRKIMGLDLGFLFGVGVYKIMHYTGVVSRFLYKAFTGEDPPEKLPEKKKSKKSKEEKDDKK